MQVHPLRELVHALTGCSCHLGDGQWGQAGVPVLPLQAPAGEWSTMVLPEVAATTSTSGYRDWLSCDRPWGPLPPITGGPHAPLTNAAPVTCD